MLLSKIFVAFWANNNIYKCKYFIANQMYETRFTKTNVEKRRSSKHLNMQFLKLAPIDIPLMQGSLKV